MADKYLAPLSNFSAVCSGGGFFNLPTWYKYLPCEGNEVVGFKLEYVWLILAAVLEMLLVLVGVLAVGYFIYGGFVLMTSQGNPERVSASRKIMMSATVGLVVAVLSASLVQLVTGAF